ncbi:uncharacterized protein V1513DRAFT_372628 [Lipomyces chichibuensis]|uniref:uncharacterized protein n=1 Tax=Lipomyces chichibuensis TaxID=1546026 RepID=UPI00334428A8
MFFRRLFHCLWTSSKSESHRQNAVRSSSRRSTSVGDQDTVKPDDMHTLLNHSAGVRMSPTATRRDGEAKIEEHLEPADITVYKEGCNLIIEDAEGEVLTVLNSETGESAPWMDDEGRRTNAFGCLIDDEIIMKNGEGKVIRSYTINRGQPSGHESNRNRSLSWKRSLPQSHSRPSHVADEEETPAERNRRLAALKGSGRSEESLIS